MTDPASLDDRDLDARLRREGEAARAGRSACPDPDLLLARGSEVLDPELRARLAAHVATCDACARLARDVDLVMADASDESQARARVLARIEPRSPGRRMAWLAVAASLVLAAGLAGVWWTRSASSPSIETASAPAPGEPAPAEPQGPRATHIEAPPVVALWTIEPAAVRVPLSALGTSRGPDAADETTTTALIEALAPYQQGDFAAAADRLEGVVQRHPDQPEAHLYLGVSYLMVDRPASAVAPLEQARALAPAARQPEIDWYLATAEQRSGQVGASRTRLRALCAGASRFKALACAAENVLE